MPTPAAASTPPADGRARTLAVTALMTARAALQVLLFIGIAAQLGPAGFGQFAAVAAIFGLLGPLTGLGAIPMAVPVVSADPARLRAVAGAVLRAVALSGVAIVLVGAAGAVAGFGARLPLALIVTVGLAEVLLVPLVDACARLLQAAGSAVSFAALSAALIAARLAVFLGWLALADSARLDAAQWGELYLLATALTAAAALACVLVRHGAPRWRGGDARGLIRGGAPMALTAMAIRAKADADKALMARLADVTSAGWYATAYRLADLVTLPVYSMLEARLVAFFAVGQGGLAAAWRHARGLFPTVWLVTALGGGALFVAAPLLPWLLGAEYAGAVTMARTLAALPLLIGSRMLVRQLLLTAGLGAASARVESLGAAASVALGLALIAPYGWAGAVAAAYLAEVAMLAAAAVVLRRRLAPA